MSEESQLTGRGDGRVGDSAYRPLLALSAPAFTEVMPRRPARARRSPRQGPARPGGSDIRRLIAELRQLTRAAERLRREGADDAALSATRIAIERKQSQLAEAVRRDPTCGRTARGAAPRDLPSTAGG